MPGAPTPARKFATLCLIARVYGGGGTLACGIDPQRGTADMFDPMDMQEKW
jgi:hypothetical protein